MQAAFKEVEDYTCEWKDLYQEALTISATVQYFFRRKKRMRRFLIPISHLSFFYTGGK